MHALEYRRLLPRFNAWLDSHPSKKLTLIEKIASYIFSKPLAESPKIPSYTIPKDILNIIVSYLPFSARQNWRLVSRYWHQYVDIHTPYWKEVERRVMEREIPQIIKNIFGGVTHIQHLPVFEFKHPDLAKSFCQPKNFRFRYHISFLRPKDIEHPITRGVTPDGNYFFILVVNNITLNTGMIMTIHETNSDWTISLSPWNYDYYAPFTEDVCLKREETVVVADPDFEPAMRLMIHGGRIRRAIGAYVKVQCDYEITDPKNILNWN